MESSTSGVHKSTKVKSITTPNLNHIKIDEVWNYVYEPAEDTFLLLDALEKDLNYIYSMQPSVVLEIGSGSGVVITSLSQVLQNSSHCLAIDINPHACKLTKSTSDHNSALVEVVQADLTTFLKDHLVDMIVFNPPYVVTPSEEVNSNDYLTKSWAGGVNGREIIDKFLENLSTVLSKTGFGYLLLLKENSPFDIMNTLEKKYFSCKVVAERKIRGEELCVVKYSRI